MIVYLIRISGQDHSHYPLLEQNLDPLIQTSDRCIAIRSRSLLSWTVTCRLVIEMIPHGLLFIEQ